MLHPIDHLLQQPEGKTLDFKRDLSSSRNVLKTLVAFVNAAGGSLVIGVKEPGTDPNFPPISHSTTSPLESDQNDVTNQIIINYLFTNKHLSHISG